MPQEPKKRHSSARQGKRRAAISLKAASSIPCPNCGSLMVPHTVCKKCGFYKGRDILSLSTKLAKQDDTSTGSVS